MAGKRDIGAIELIVGAHVAIFIVGVSWAFGGNADWVRIPIAAWGSIGIALTFVALGRAALRHEKTPSAIFWVWPVVVFNIVVLLSGLHPGFKSLSFHGEALLMPIEVPWWAPSSTQYSNSLRSLWLFDGIYFSCVNLALAVRSKRLLRGITAAAVGNGVALAAMGIAQKVLNSTGIYFGRIPSPNQAFFASFVYDNHWGSFIVLMSGAGIGLILRYAYGLRGWGFLHGPALTGIVAVCIMDATVPLSGSRACTLLLIAQVLYAVIEGFPRIMNGLSVSGIGPRRAYALVIAVAATAVAGLWSVAGDALKARIEVTRQQILHHGAIGDGISRRAVYVDTWRMARQHPLFGWGMGSYPTVFPLFNTQVRPTEHLPVVYHDAHSDMLQSLAEIGFVGTMLIGVAVALPVLSISRLRKSPFQKFLMSGCVLVAGYALVEFPFGNIAVTLSWWFCLIVAVHYQRLSGTREKPEEAT